MYCDLFNCETRPKIPNSIYQAFRNVSWQPRRRHSSSMSFSQSVSLCISWTSSAERFASSRRRKHRIRPSISSDDNVAAGRCDEVSLSVTTLLRCGGSSRDKTRHVASDVTRLSMCRVVYACNSDGLKVTRLKVC